MAAATNGTAEDSTSQVRCVGYNRIRIEPVHERRTGGSIGDNIVRSLMARYGLSEDVVETIPDEILGLSAKPFEVVDAGVDRDGGCVGENGDEDGGRVDNMDLNIPDGQRKVDKQEGTKMETTPAVQARSEPPEPEIELVHHMDIPGEYLETTNHSAPLGEEFEPIVLNGIGGFVGFQSSSLGSMNPDEKINLIDRQSGKIIRGDNAVRVCDLTSLLRKRASLEPIIPPAGNSTKRYVGKYMFYFLLFCCCFILSDSVKTDVIVTTFLWHLTAKQTQKVSHVKVGLLLVCL